jgi:class 3 adenylate cyclase/tetratricopeptide (TPR) repeat protein
MSSANLQRTRDLRLNCSNCGTDNPAGRRFCDNCGSALASACPTCGEANRPDARFCGNCGTGLGGTTAPVAVSSIEPPSAATQAVAERRLVSVLFADLVGFTPFAEEKDPEEVRNLLTRYFDSAREVIERHGGTVEKFIGDAVMAVWGTPVAHEDDAERAVRAALELLPAVRAVDERLQARAGVVSGEAAVNVAAVGQGMVAGDLVNTAARLQSVAPPSTVLVGESTMRAASAAIAYEPAGEQALKGKTAPVPAWRALRVIAERGGRARAETIEPPFVGRDAELTLLKDLFHATGREGRPRLVAVVGPAGIGKSRLGWELEKYVDGLVEGVWWHSGRSPSYGEDVAFWALGEMVRRRCGLAEDDDEQTTRERVTATVVEYVATEEDRRLVEPALLALLGVEPAPPGGRDVLFAAWRIFFENVATRGTTVLVFEDLQFADSGLLDFIDHLLEWSRSSPILVLALARPELLERRPGFGSAARQFSSMPLEPLADEHMRELLAGIVPDLDERAAASIVVRADGIPLYAVETVRMLIADGYLEGCEDGSCRVLRELGEVAIPDTLRSLISSRLDALDAADRSLLQQASVIGQSFTLDALAGVSSRPPAELTDRLRAFVRRELIALEADPRSPERGQYRFVQGLIREVAYGTLARRERRERHLAAARYFEATGDEETAGALASHYLAAHQASETGPEADAVASQARIALRAAAERAASLGAYEQAVSHLEQALGVTTDPADRADLFECAARAAESAARYDYGIEAARSAIATYRELDDEHGAVRSSGLLGTLLVDLARHTEAIEVLQSALDQAPDDDPALRAETAARLSRALMRSMRHREAIAAADAALEVAERRGMTGIVAEALVNKGSSLANAGRWREGTALSELGVALAEQAGNSELHLRALNNLAAGVVEDDPARAVRITTEALAVARRLGLRGMVNWLMGTVSYGRHWHGLAWDETMVELAVARDEAGNDLDSARLSAALLAFRLVRGEIDDAELARIEATIGDTDDPALGGALLTLRANRMLVAGELLAAHELFARSAARSEADEEPFIGLMRVSIWRHDLTLAKEAQAAIERLPFSGRAAMASHGWSRAAVAALEGRRDEAVRDLVAAYEAVRALEMDFEAARIALDAVTLLPDEAVLQPPAEWARRKFEELGARPYLERLEVALAGTEVAATG